MGSGQEGSRPEIAKSPFFRYLWALIVIGYAGRNGTKA